MKKLDSKWRDIFGSELDYICKLGSAIHDPHAKREFWENVKQKKLADPKFSIYDLFPTSKDPKSLAKRYGGEILDMLRGKMNVEEKCESEIQEQKDKK